MIDNNPIEKGKLTQSEFTEILNQNQHCNDLEECLYCRDWNESYSVPVNLTIEEIRKIYNALPTK